MMIASGGECGRRRKPKNGIFGVFSFEGAGESEYTEEPFTIVRTLLCSAPNREEDCDAGESLGPASWSGRGDLKKDGKGIAKGIES